MEKREKAGAKKYRIQMAYEGAGIPSFDFMGRQPQPQYKGISVKQQEKPKYEPRGPMSMSLLPRESQRIAERIGIREAARQPMEERVEIRAEGRAPQQLIIGRTAPRPEAVGMVGAETSKEIKRYQFKDRVSAMTNEQLRQAARDNVNFSPQERAEIYREFGRRHLTAAPTGEREAVERREITTFGELRLVDADLLDRARAMSRIQEFIRIYKRGRWEEKAQIKKAFSFALARIYSMIKDRHNRYATKIGDLRYNYTLYQRAAATLDMQERTLKDTPLKFQIFGGGIFG